MGTGNTSQTSSFGGNQPMGYGSQAAGTGAQEVGTGQTSSFGGMGHGSQAVGTDAQGPALGMGSQGMGTGFKEGGDENYGTKAPGAGKASMTDKFMGEFFSPFQLREC